MWYTIKILIMNINYITEKINLHTYALIGEFLFQEIPKFQEKYDLELVDEDTIVGGYFFMHYFASSLAQKLETDNNSDLILNSFNFINELGKSRNLEVLNILKAGILETLYTSDVRIKVRTFLKGKV